MPLLNEKLSAAVEKVVMPDSFERIGSILGPRFPYLCVFLIRKGELDQYAKFKWPDGIKDMKHLSAVVETARDMLKLANVEGADNSLHQLPGLPDEVRAFLNIGIELWTMGLRARFNPEITGLYLLATVWEGLLEMELMSIWMDAFLHDSGSEKYKSKTMQGTNYRMLRVGV